MSKFIFYSIAKKKLPGLEPETSEFKTCGLTNTATII
jgi:hypothetical protein